MKAKKIKTIGIFVNQEKKKALVYLKRLFQWLNREGYRVLLNEAAASMLAGTRRKLNISDRYAGADLLLVLGGDGTLLSAIHQVGNKRIPLLGVNFGKLGFLTETTEDKLYPYLKNIFRGRYKIEERILLSGSIERGRKSIKLPNALNDYVIGKGAMARTLKLEVSIGRERVISYAVDGLIIATATGSTAYSLSAGGPIVLPDARGLIITPICPHTLNNRPLVISDQSFIEVDVISNIKDLSLTADGQSLFQIRAKDRIIIKKSASRIRLITAVKKNHYKTLREKMNWSGETTRRYR